MAELKQPGDSYTSRIVGLSTGLVGTIRFRLVDDDSTADDPVHGPTTAGIIEEPTGSGSYLFRGTLPTTQGKYARLWDTGVGTALIADEDVVVTWSLAASSLPSARDLCALADVAQLVPGYTSDADTDALLSSLITSESRQAHQRSGREFVTISGATTRQIDLGTVSTKTRRVHVGDMTTVTTVTIEDQEGTTVETVSSSDRVSLGWKRNRTREEWEPITQLWFPPGSATPASLLGPGYVLEVVGVWGFPSIPADVVNATAKMVLVRYLADAASAGTALSDALNEQGFDAGRAFVSARDVIRSYTLPPIA